MSEIWTMTARALGAAIADGATSAVELLECHLDRVAELNPRYNAVTRTMEERARTLAIESDRRTQQGERRGPLDGVPFTTKENLDCVGAPTTEALVGLADNMPDRDAPVVERMIDVGAVPFARTNMPDLGLRIHTDNDLHGPTVNPWDPTRTCGGSSGGEGVAIATGMSPMGIGNDIGGSVRNPAYCSGITAHKPTPHRLPRSSSTPPTSWGPAKQLMSVNGPMARSVGDLVEMFGSMHGRHRRDPWSVTTAFDPDRTPKGPVALVAEPAGGATDPVIAAGVRSAGAALQARGYEVVEVAPPDVAGVASSWKRWLGGEIDLRRTGIDPLISAGSRRVLDLFHEAIGPQNLESTIDALTERHAHAQAWLDFFQVHPTVVGPVWCRPPFRVGADLESAVEILESLRFTVVANVLALPATSVPVGVGEDGIPLGVQVLAQQHDDHHTLAVAAAIEAEVGTVVPPVV